MLNPFGLLALLALPAIVGIHLYRNRQRTVVVTGLFLYGPEARSLASGRTRRPLVWRTSLWLELLAALALAWWLCDIRLGDLARVHHAVVVLDTRLRLSARHDGVAVSERLRKELDARIAALSADDRVTVIASGEPPRLLAGPAAEPIAARKALAKWSADSGWHDLDAALGLAAELAEGSGEITLVSDRIPERLPNAIGVLAGGRSAATSGLAEVRRFPDRVAVRVYASGAKAERIVVLRSAAGELARTRIEIPADGQALVVLPGPSTGALTVALLGDDPLPDDDHVELLPPRPPEVRVATRDQAHPAVTAALRAVAGVTLVDPTDRPDLIVAQPPGKMQGDDSAWSVTIEPGPASPVLGPFLARRGHPLLADLEFTGVVWAGGGRLAALPADQVLLAAGDAVLLSELRDGRRRAITIHGDPAGGTLTRHPAWPALWANLIAARRSALPGLADPNVRCDRAVAVVAPPGAAWLTVADSGTAPPAAGPAPGNGGEPARLALDGDGRAVIPGFAHPGRWTVRADDGRVVVELSALALDPRHGDLIGAATTERAPATASGLLDQRRPAAEHLLPLLIAALAGLGAWWSWRRE
ncbi:hypothetical protein LBMAG53_22960 [Planctomycetota bacterium]|nr:hypothetical protein LBMAG53_22960 [Planctomycetota bacterium]